jgi:hypothetical protein
VRAETGPVNVSVAGIHSVCKGYINLIFGDDGTVVNYVSQILFEASTCSLRASLLPWALGVNVVLQTSTGTDKCCKLMTYELRALVSDDKFWPAIVLDPHLGKTIPSANTRLVGELARHLVTCSPTDHIEQDHLKGSFREFH